MAPQRGQARPRQGPAASRRMPASSGKRMRYECRLVFMLLFVIYWSFAFNTGHCHQTNICWTEHCPPYQHPGSERPLCVIRHFRYNHHCTDSLAIAEGAAAAALLRSTRKDEPHPQGSTDSSSADPVQALAADHRCLSESLAAAEAAAAARADEASAAAQRAAAAEAAAVDTRAQLDQAQIQLQVRDPLPCCRAEFAAPHSL